MRLIKHILCTILLSLTLFRFDCHAVYDVDVMEAYINAVKGQNYNFKQLCGFFSDDKGCINDFKSTKLQPMQAYGLIELYAQRNLKQKLVCNPNFETRQSAGARDDYVQCVTVDGKQNYEFRFDTLEKNSTMGIYESLFKLFCEMHGGNLSQGLSDSGYEHFCYNTGAGGCNSIKADMQIFGSDAEWIEPQLDKSGKNTGNYCYSKLHYKQYNLRNPFENFLNNKVFAGYQLRAFSDMEIVLRRYTEIQFKKNNKKLNSFKCNKGFTPYATGNLLNPLDDIVSCRVNGSYVDFVFDDLTETEKVFTDAALDGLYCILDQGGIFDGEQCYGLSYQQCKKLENDPELKTFGRIEWDDKLETCVIELNNAAAANVTALKNKILSTIGIAAGFLILSLVTGGASGSVMAIIGTSATSTSIGAATTAIIIEEVEKFQVQEFLTKANQCQNSGCAKTLLKDFLSDAALYKDNLDDTLKNGFDETVAAMIDKIDDPGFYDKVVQNNPSFWAQTLDTTHAGAELLSAVADVITLSADKMAKIPQTVQKIGQMPKFVSSLTRNVKTYARIFSKMSNVNTIASNVVNALAQNTNDSKSNLPDDQLTNIAQAFQFIPTAQLNNITKDNEFLKRAKNLSTSDKNKLLQKLPVTHRDIVFKKLDMDLPDNNQYNQILNSSM